LRWVDIEKVSDMPLPSSMLRVSLAFYDRAEPILLKRKIVSIGSASGCDIVLEDSAVSGRHAMLRHMDGVWLVQDLGSANGTWINGHRIDRPTKVNAGDRIAFGRIRCVLRNGADSSGSVIARIISLSPYEFETLIGLLFSRLNFDTAVTKQTRDGGVDVEAINNGLIYRGRYLIQCKRYNSTHKVSLPEIQSFHGRLAREPRARGIFITTSSFTRGARSEAVLTGINLIDGKELTELIIRHNLLSSVG
jgi:pSer/pThr/pTyr-binding forkhead associated (FHA) protein